LLLDKIPEILTNKFIKWYSLIHYYSYSVPLHCYKAIIYFKTTKNNFRQTILHIAFTVKTSRPARGFYISSDFYVTKAKIPAPVAIPETISDRQLYPLPHYHRSIDHDLYQY
jgi:hypothetical protein